MEIGETLHVFDDYNLWLIIIGLGIMSITILPRVLSSYPFSMPMVLLILGFAVIALPLGLEAPNPKTMGNYTEHLTELGVIVALMGAGLKIDRPPSFRGWNVTWRLLGITMILTIGLSALLGWWILALTPAAALLLGAVIAPTDPVLAAEVQVGAPGAGSENTEVEEKGDSGNKEEDQMRFALTSEAGLNDGFAFPFTNMAIAMTIAGAHPRNWVTNWLLIDVLYQLILAIIVGIVLGYFAAHIFLNRSAKTELAKAMMGIGSLAATLIIYGATEYIGGYGFIAVFAGAVAIRNYQRDHDYHKNLHIFIEKSERLFTAVILIAFGGAIAGGLLEPLTWEIVLCAILIIFIVRPLTGVIGLIGFKQALWRERFAISFMGIRGIGSFYYLAYALNQGDFPEGDDIWALVGLIVVISIFIHGFTATPITKKLDKLREKEGK